MRQLFFILFSLYSLSACSHRQAKTWTVVPPATEVHTTAPLSLADARPMRGVWLATVANLDWPARASWLLSSDAARVESQKSELIATLDNLVAVGVNTIFFQVKPDATALYRSKILPWSGVMTGTIGKDPGFDPLAFILAQAHQRGLKLHAWLNPYRVTTSVDADTLTALQRTATLAPASVYLQHREWIRTADERLVLDPGIPGARDWINAIVTELVTNYAVDGVQFDDYFYQESPRSKLNDDTTWLQYGAGFMDKASWRRNNTLLLIKQISTTVRRIRPSAQFGISPSGVWRNRRDDVRGSATQSGIPAYDVAYADTYQWVKQGWLDYIAPQLYWPVARQIASYATLVNWWADVVRSTNTKLYIGIALYKVGARSHTEPDWVIDGGVTELQRQLTLDAALAEVDGEILFREAYLRAPQTAQAVNYLRYHWRTLPRKQTRVPQVAGRHLLR